MAATPITQYAFEQLEAPARPDGTRTDPLSSAWAEAEEIRATARREGESAGYEEGLARATAHAAPLNDTLGAAARELASAREELLDGLVHQAAELSIAAAEQILGATLELRPELLVETVHSALRRLAERQRVTVLVSPDDLDLLSGEVARMQAELGGIEHLDLQGDRRVGRGGAIARTAQGEIDATISTQLQSVRAIVAAALRGEPDSEDPGSAGGDD